jgi:hypothetical protein
VRDARATASCLARYQPATYLWQHPRMMILASALTLSVIAIVVAAASFVVSGWQAATHWREFRNRQKARVAVDPGHIRSDGDRWIVELWLTNVGASHARRVRVWLEDLQGNRLTQEARIPRPLLAGGDSHQVEIAVPRNERSSLVVRPVRRWRDGRDTDEAWTDRSRQEITLE